MLLLWYLSVCLSVSRIFHLLVVGTPYWNVHILTTFHKWKRIIFIFVWFWKSFFVYSSNMETASFPSSLAYRNYSTYCCMIAAKLGVVTEIFPLEGAEVFDRGLFKSSLNLGCKSAWNRTWSVAPLWGRIAIQRLFREQVIFHTLQLAFKYRQIRCTPLSSYISVKHQQRADYCWFAASRLGIHLSDRWSVALRPSVCPSVLTIYSKSECSRKFGFIGHSMQSWVNDYQVQIRN